MISRMQLSQDAAGLASPAILAGCVYASCMCKEHYPVTSFSLSLSLRLHVCSDLVGAFDVAEIFILTHTSCQMAGQGG